MLWTNVKAKKEILEIKWFSEHYKYIQMFVVVCFPSIYYRNALFEKLQSIDIRHFWQPFIEPYKCLQKRSLRKYNFLDFKLRYRLKFEIKALLLLIKQIWRTAMSTGSQVFYSI